MHYPSLFMTSRCRYLSQYRPSHYSSGKERCSLISLFCTSTRSRIDLAPDTTYQRLLIHRCAAYYLLTPEADPTTRGISLTVRAESRMWVFFAFHSPFPFTYEVSIDQFVRCQTSYLLRRFNTPPSKCHECSGSSDGRQHLVAALPSRCGPSGAFLVLPCELFP